MKHYLKRYAKNFDYPLFFTVLLLSLFGLIMVYSSSMMVAIRKGEAPDFFYQKQIINLIVAFLGFIVAAFFPYKHYANKNIMMILTIILAVLFTWLKVAGHGAEDVGSQSWINVPGLGNFQPSEYSKLFIILYFAAAFYRKAQKIYI